MISSASPKLTQKINVLLEDCGWCRRTIMTGTGTVYNNYSKHDIIAEVHDDSDDVMQ